MDLIPRTSYANEFISIAEFYKITVPYNGWEMACANLFRDDEWMLVDNADYAKNTYQDVLKLADDEDFKPCFKVFLDDVIGCMKYNLSQIED